MSLGQMLLGLPFGRLGALLVGAAVASCGLLETTTKTAADGADQTNPAPLPNPGDGDGNGSNGSDGSPDDGNDSGSGSTNGIENVTPTNPNPASTRVIYQADQVISTVLAVLDFNGDGYPDILVGGANNQSLNEDPVVLLLNNGGQGEIFTDGTAAHILGPIPALAAPHAAVADFNNDGTPDVALFDAGHGELGQHNDGGFFGGPPHLLLSQSATTWQDSTALLDAVNAATTGSCWPTCDGVIHMKAVATGDIDNDGDIDMFVESGGGYNNPAPHFLINGGDGTFALDASNNRRNDSIIWGPGAWRYASHVLADINNDGFLDLVMGQLRRRDNNQDALTNKVVLNNGSGQFAQANVINLPYAGSFDQGYTYVKAQNATDLDGDGDLDLVLVHERSNLIPDPNNVGNTGRYVQVLIQDGMAAGTFVDQSDAWMGDQRATTVATQRPYGSNYNAPGKLEIRDFDADGADDLLMVGANAIGDHAPFWYKRVGNTFVPQETFYVTDGQEWVGEGAIPFDVNADGQLELLHLNGTAGPDGNYGTADDAGEVLLTTLPRGPEPLAAPDGTDPVVLPRNLRLPFNLDDITLQARVLSPFGVVRRNLDHSEFGHGGIDIPLVAGAPLVAVTDGVVAALSESSHGNGLHDLWLLLHQTALASESESEPAGWVFVYESMALADGIGVASTVTAGQVLGHHPSPPVTSHHLQLSYLAQTFLFHHTCWVPQILAPQRAKLYHDFAALALTSDFTDGWHSATDDGMLPLRGLLDDTAFPNGPMLCYPPGTDVREPI